MRRDIDFSFKRHPLTGDLVVKTGSNAIRQSLINIVRSNFGDRGFNIEFGTNLDYSLFENMTLLTAGTVKSNIVNAIENFEPSVEIIDVQVFDDTGDLVVKIYYTELNDPKEQAVVIQMRRVR